VKVVVSSQPSITCYKSANQKIKIRTVYESWIIIVKHYLNQYRVVFTWVSKSNKFCMTLLSTRLSQKTCATFSFNLKGNQNQLWLTHTCFPALHISFMYLLQVKIGSYCLSVSFVIGQSDYTGFGFMTLNWKLL